MESSDLGELTAVPLARDAEIDRKHEIEGLYHFDPSSDDELFKLRASAIRLGEVLGIAAGAAEQSVDARWVISDTASEERCEVGGIGWTSCEFVEDQDENEWLDEK